jgi:hypothetical protein
MGAIGNCWKPEASALIENRAGRGQRVLWGCYASRCHLIGWQNDGTERCYSRAHVSNRRPAKFHPVSRNPKEMFGDGFIRSARR